MILGGQRNLHRMAADPPADRADPTAAFVPELAPSAGAVGAGVLVVVGAGVEVVVGDGVGVGVSPRSAARVEIGVGS